MGFHVDPRIHSKFSRATGRDCDFEHRACWAPEQGVSVIGKGHFTPESLGNMRGLLKVNGSERRLMVSDQDDDVHDAGGSHE
jgi:PHP family Zn ribbon phosphoesterase